MRKRNEIGMLMGVMMLSSLLAGGTSGRQVTRLDGAGWTLDGAAVTVPHTWNVVDGADGKGPVWGDSASARSYLRRRGVYRRAPFFRDELSDAYANYPMTNFMQYYGPFHFGFVWPLFPKVELKPLSPTWKPDYPPSAATASTSLASRAGISAASSERPETFRLAHPSGV